MYNLFNEFNYENLLHIKDFLINISKEMKCYIKGGKADQNSFI